MYENSALLIGFGVIVAVLLYIVWVIVAPKPAPKYRRHTPDNSTSSTEREERIEAEESKDKYVEPVNVAKVDTLHMAKESIEQSVSEGKPSPMEMTPEEAEATALPFQEPVVVRREDYRHKRYNEPIPETKNIDTECFGYFKGASVLIVEDNLINQKILLGVLKRAGIHVDVANNGQEAIDLLIEQGHRYDLVIMDISMPVMDGIEATRRIRQYPEFDDMPIVTFTAFNLGPEIKRMFDAGANAYLTKPLNINQLYTVFTLFVGNPQQEVAFDRMLEIHGLDIAQGLENAEADKEKYREKLQRFKHRYASTADQFGQWIERGDYDRAKLELRDMYADAVDIGAFDLGYFLKDLQKYFIYRNEHLVSRHLLMFKTKLQTLLDAIELYLSASDKPERRDSPLNEDLAQLNEK